MDAAEVERELEELETRIERLRSLYEQYFMGLEKLEPLTLRKDIERRIWVLRREQIRNTGLRFKFQMLLQRFNTFQQYWGRITREIENGTYRRDVMRVAKRFGEKEALTILGRKRAKQFAVLAAQQAVRARTSEESGFEELADEDLLEEELGERELEEEVADDDIEDDTPTQVSLRFRELPVAESLQCAPPSEEEPGPPQLAAGSSRATPGAHPGAPEVVRQRVAEFAAQMNARHDQAEAANANVDPLELDLDLDSGPRTSKRSTRPPPRRTPSVKMGAVKLPTPPAGAVTSQGVVVGARRSSSPLPAAEDDSGLEEKRLRQIYAKYIETKRTANEPTAGITFEKLAASLRAQAVKLRQSHLARSVDYDVIIKDGKTLLKPIIR